MSTRPGNTNVNRFLPLLSVCGIVIAVYVNTLGHDFTQDDAIVIYQNELVKKGTSGIAEIFRHDSFFGFFKEEGKSSLVSGGRYRPLSLAYFACLYQWFSDDPFWFHLSSLFWYGFLVSLVYLFSLQIRPLSIDKYKLHFAIIVAILFTTHPVHTEVVANVKGHDEIFSLLFGITALLLTLNWHRSPGLWKLILACLAFLAALMAKENAVAFLFLIPFTAWYLGKIPNWRSLVSPASALTFTLILYLIVRFSIIGFPSSEAPEELMNNPFIKYSEGRYLPYNTNEKFSSIVVGMAKYLQLLIFPHPLTNDYYPRFFEVYTISNPAVMAAGISLLSLILLALVGLKKRSFSSYAIVFFFCSIFLVTNVLFPVGTHLSERFLFTPSLGFCLLVGYALVRLYKNYPTGAISLLVLVISLYSVKTITRNRIWKDDFTLFTTDVKVSKNSAKAQNAAGGALLTRSVQIEDQKTKDEMYQQAIAHLTQAIAIHPAYKNAHLLLGNAHNYLRNYDQSIASYRQALRLDPYYTEAENNLHLTYREAGRYAGQSLNDISRAKDYLHEALELRPNDYDTNSLLGVAYGNDGDHRSAVAYFEKAVELRPDLPRAYVNLGYALLNLGEEEEAQINFQKAVRLDPEALN